MQITTSIPDADSLRQIRERLGLSQTELAVILWANPKSAHVVRSWETNPDHFRPTPLAWTALRFLLLAVEVYRELDPASPGAKKIGNMLPEALR